MSEHKKPLSICKDELLKDLIQIVNSSELPMFVIEYILMDVLNNVHSLANEQHKMDISNYNKRKSSEVDE